MYDYVSALAIVRGCYLAVARNAVRFHHRHLLSPIFRDNVRMIRCEEMRVSACNNLILFGGDLNTAAPNVLDHVQVIRCVDNISLLS